MTTTSLPVQSSATQWLQPPHDFTLSNGLWIVLDERPGSALTEMRLVTPDGFAGEPLSGRAALAMELFNQAPPRSGARARLGALGAMVQAYVTADSAIIKVSALAHNLRRVLGPLVEWVAQPAFTDDSFSAVRSAQLRRIEEERLNPLDFALRTFPRILYPPRHPCAQPFTGSGMVSSLASLTAADVRDWYTARMTPERATLVIAGGPAYKRLIPLLEDTFGRWHTFASAKPRIEPPTEAPPATAAAPSPVLIMDRPEHPQSGLFAGLLGVPRGSQAAETVLVADAVLAGMFSSRLNLLLREREGWTYGVRSMLLDNRRQGWYLLSCFVRDDRTVEAMDRIESTLRDLAERAPCSAPELARAVNHVIGRVVAAHETCAQSADALAQMITWGLPAAYYVNLADRLRHLGTADITGIFRHIFAGEALHWIVTGRATRLVAACAIAGRNAVEVGGD
jgi:zinc protease